jgi:hypothetical protein
VLDLCVSIEENGVSERDCHSRIIFFFSFLYVVNLNSIYLDLLKMTDTKASFGSRQVKEYEREYYKRIEFS